MILHSYLQGRPWTDSSYSNWRLLTTLLEGPEIDVLYLAVPLIGADVEDFQSAIDYVYWLREKVAHRDLLTTPEIAAIRARLPVVPDGKRNIVATAFEQLLMLVTMLLTRSLKGASEVFTADERRSRGSCGRFYTSIKGMIIYCFGNSDIDITMATVLCVYV